MSGEKRARSPKLTEEAIVLRTCLALLRQTGEKKPAEVLAAKLGDCPQRGSKTLWEIARGRMLVTLPILARIARATAELLGGVLSDLWQTLQDRKARYGMA